MNTDENDEEKKTSSSVYETTKATSNIVIPLATSAAVSPKSMQDEMIEFSSAESPQQQQQSSLPATTVTTTNNSANEFGGNASLSTASKSGAKKTGDGSDRDDDDEDVSSLEDDDESSCGSDDNISVDSSTPAAAASALAQQFRAKAGNWWKTTEKQRMNIVATAAATAKEQRQRFAVNVSTAAANTNSTTEQEESTVDATDKITNDKSNANATSHATQTASKTDVTSTTNENCIKTDELTSISTKQVTEFLLPKLQNKAYVLHLGRGMLGVNLKQCYKKSTGVYIDYCVPGGCANRASQASANIAAGDFVYIGDTLVSITECGETKPIPLHTETIATAPSIISQTKRPAAIALLPSGAMITTSTSTTSKKKNNPLLKSDTIVDHIDVAIGAICIKKALLLLKQHQQYQQTMQLLPSTVPPSPPRQQQNTKTEEEDRTKNNNSNAVNSEVTSSSKNTEQQSTNDDLQLIPIQFCGDAKKKTATSTKADDANSSDTSLLRVLLNPGLPSQSVQDHYCVYGKQRNPIHIEHQELPFLLVTDGTTTTSNASADSTGAGGMIVTNTVQAAVQNAFVEIVTDQRRLSFLMKYLQNDLPHDNKSHGLVLLYLDLLHFSTEKFDILAPLPKQQLDTSSSTTAGTTGEASSKSNRLYSVAKNIAYKYFLPQTTIDSNGQVRIVEQPIFDFHTLVHDNELRVLETQLRLSTSEQRHESEEGSIKIDRTVFLPFQMAALNKLTIPILGFLTSVECARMRAYLRNISPYRNVCIHPVLHCAVRTASSASDTSNNQAHARNYLTYIVTYLLCLTDQDAFGENDDLLELQGAPGRGQRIISSHGLCAVIYVRTKLLPAIQSAENDDNSGITSEDGSPRVSTSPLVHAYRIFWTTFIMLGSGLLQQGSRSIEVVQALDLVFKKLSVIKLLHNDDDFGCPDSSSSSVNNIVGTLTSPDLVDAIESLCHELVYDFTVNIQPHFRMHKFHEWLCSEITATNDDTNNLPHLAPGCIKRLLQRSNFPVGVTPHKLVHGAPTSVAADTNPHTPGNEANSPSITVNEQEISAQCAVVFGTELYGRPDDYNSHDGIDAEIERYSCQSLFGGGDGVLYQTTAGLTPEEIPATFESYATVPLTPDRPFGQYAGDHTRTSDGWQVSLVNFLVPRADAGDGDVSSLYGVSLVLRKKTGVGRNKTEITDNFSVEVVNQLPEKCAALNDNNSNETILRLPDDIPQFRNAVATTDWYDRVATQSLDEENRTSAITIGIALVSHANVIPSMREALSKLFHSFTLTSTKHNEGRVAAPLVRLLGGFSPGDIVVEECVARRILDSFIKAGTKQWIERPLGAQADHFVEEAGRQLSDCLSPIPLALMFVTALLEQKIVFTSSRRSLLLSATTALCEMLRPLQWHHLLVPRVQVLLARDLLQYPAPFILGIPTEEPGALDIIRDLPDDVTLVDLDVGRVILASALADGIDLGRGGGGGLDQQSVNETSKLALRAQVLYLAQSLGGAFASRLIPQSWSVDIPSSFTFTNVSSVTTPFQSLRILCQSFIREMLFGIQSCCYWIVEHQIAGSLVKSDPTILFDEDRFFHLKSCRCSDESIAKATITQTNDNRSNGNMTLSVDNFDLVLELFLRCQSMNAYIGSLDPSEMLFYFP